MKQFTQAQAAHFREKLTQDPGILTVLDAAIRPVRANYRIQTTGRATWGGFFACPKHSVNLTFDIADPLHYRCPVDGEAFTGAPYEGAWWRLLNGKNEEACRMAALRYLLLGEAEDLELARRILVDYAAHYPGYETHGGIPYNEPGKANAQTLCDALWLKGLAAGYDIIRDELDEKDRELIERDLFRCGASFLMEHRSNQIHNHECIVSSAVGILGILLSDEDYLHFALDTPYGLKYQLAHAVLRDGFWFEGTPSYHFFAMQQFVEFERFARDRADSFFRDPRFVQVLKFPIHLTQPDGMLPTLNDAGNNARGFAGAEYLYELAFARTGDPDFAQLMRLAYQNKPRLNVHAFFDGVDALPEAAPPLARDYHGGGPGASGLTVMHGPDGRFLLVKHSPYGGEHDHYDRLGIHFLGLGRYIAPDIGTTQYGAPLHYAYYKNTVTHNTVCIDGRNQPPANCTVREYIQKDGMTVLDAQVCWDGTYQPLDSFTIPQWSEEAYRGAVMRRHITWHGDLFIDCFDVRLPGERDIDWVFHVRGELAPGTDAADHADRWTAEGAGQYIRDVKKRGGNTAIAHTAWRIAGHVRLDVYTLARDVELFHALGPDNPSVSELSYLIERRRAAQARFVNVICAAEEGAPVIRSVEEENGGLVIWRADGGCVRYTFPAALEQG